MDTTPDLAEKLRPLALDDPHVDDIRRKELCSSCMNISFNDIFTISTSQDPLVQYLGQLESITQRRKICGFCDLLVQSYEKLINPYLQDIYASDVTQSHLFLVSNIDNKPWYDAAGVHAPSLPTTSTAWLQIEPTEEYQCRINQPLVCISWSTVSEQVSPKARFALPRRRTLDEASRASINSSLVARWLKICDDSHTEVCDHTGNVFKRNFIKTEFINVRSRRIVPKIGNEPYAALSYVWGLPKPSQSSESTADMQTHFAASQKFTVKSKVLPKQIPKTIADAMTLVSEIGLKFLWVDLFCIDQTDHEAKQDQINDMHLIFECAYVTIVALDADNMNVGISGMSKPLKYSDQPVVDLSFGRFMSTFVDAIWDKQGNTPWDRRAWTLQEGLLSRRCLYFDSSHFYMSCGEEFFHSALEADDSSDRIPTNGSDTWYSQYGFAVDIKAPAYSQKVYGAFVDNFTRRQISFQSDALNACRAALTKFSTSTGVGFTWGIPIKNIAYGLLWQPEINRYLLRRPQFPSWSWLGWIGRIAYPYFIDEREDYYLDVGTKMSRHARAEGSNTKPGVVSKPRHDVLKSHEAAIQMNVTGNVDETRTLRISSTIARFNLARVTSDPYKYPKRVGIRWALLDKRGQPLINELGENLGDEESLRFQTISHFFRLSPETSKSMDEKGSQAEFLFVKYWPAIRDHHIYCNWRHGIVSALLITQNTDGTYSREASITMKCSDWLAANPLPRVIELR